VSATTEPAANRVNVFIVSLQAANGGVAAPFGALFGFG
jgi:hypothetical protein